ncbi:MAG TPA: hypothetical protein VFS67_19130 [Polyangiaceae bacterium]|jgi:hypothetical protein|nr:hypothetical protein [Polyangiaceae bacterium]
MSRPFFSVLLVGASVLAVVPAHAESTPGSPAPARDAAEFTAAAAPAPRPRRAIGFTIDLLPIVLSASVGELGLSGQIWFGFEHIRLRLVGARLALPDWVGAEDGFEDQQLIAAATIVDYVFGEHFDSWWVGGGFEYWHSSIGHEDVAGRRVSWDAAIATVGGGYIWRALGNDDVSFYVEPWAAAHLRVTPASPELDGHTYTPSRINGELSLKIGVFFDL